MSNDMPDVIYVEKLEVWGADGAYSNHPIKGSTETKYLSASHVAENYVPKAEHDSAREVLAMIAYKTDEAGEVANNVLENHALTSFEKLKAEALSFQEAEEAVRLFKSEYIGQSQSYLWEWAKSTAIKLLREQMNE